jgi:transcriptional regulator with XRE-family HTH domain
MILNDQDFELEKKRVDAKITQAEMATFLGISQSQVSRYEQDPDNVPAGTLKKWLQICGEIAGGQGLEMEDPRIELKGRLELMKAYAAVEPQRGYVPEKNVPLNAAGFLASVEIMARKPRVGVFGQFDAGKSRLINVLLGGSRLPTSYQPATSIVCLLRHASEKPTWQAEDVWLMRKGFNLDMADDAEHCLEHKLFAGGYESLAQYGTHTGSGKEHKAFAAVVYVDAPLLLAAEVVDLPGYGHSEDDKDRAEIAQKMVDVLIYASQATGFMDQNDLTYLNVLINNLPVSKNSHGGYLPLRNMLIVATHAHHVDQPATRTAILDAAAVRCYKHLENVVAERAARAEAPITSEEFRSRMFTFSADDSTIRSAFEQDLKNLLGGVLPDSKLLDVQKHVSEAKNQATLSCTQWIASLQIALDEREKAQREITEIQSHEPNRLRKKQAHQQKINGLIDSFANESQALISKTFAEKTSVAAIEAMIKRRYEDKKEAQQLAASYLVDSVQKSINDGVRVKANELGQEIDVFLDGYGPAIDKTALMDGGWDFNARVAFMSAMSGIGTIGALAAWASIAAAGSNLGGYILIGQVVGWLSSIGISLGGAGTVMTFVSAIGGPITIGIAAAVGVVLAVFALFGDSWQTKLAKKIHEGLMKQDGEKQMSKGVAKYWAETKNAFEIAVAKTEEAYQAKLKSLYVLAFTTKREEIEAELKLAKETRDFFAGMPWRTMPS